MRKIEILIVLFVFDIWENEKHYANEVIYILLLNINI